MENMLKKTYKRSGRAERFVSGLPRGLMEQRSLALRLVRSVGKLDKADSSAFDAVVPAFSESLLHQYLNDIFNVDDCGPSLPLDCLQTVQLLPNYLKSGKWKGKFIALIYHTLDGPKKSTPFLFSMKMTWCIQRQVCTELTTGHFFNLKALMMVKLWLSVRKDFLLRFDVIQTLYICFHRQLPCK